MFISSSHNDQIQSKRTDLVSTVRKLPVADRGQRRYQYLFQSSPLHSDKSLYRHVLGLVNNFLNQIMGRQSLPATTTDTAALNEPRQVRGIADRSPRLVDPANPEPARDSIFLGEAKDYPAAVIAIEYGKTIKPVFYEGNQVVARHLTLNSEQSSIDGALILNDGTRMPVNIMIITAV